MQRQPSLPSLFLDYARREHTPTVRTDLDLANTVAVTTLCFVSLCNNYTDRCVSRIGFGALVVTFTSHEKCPIHIAFSYSWRKLSKGLEVLLTFLTPCNLQGAVVQPFFFSFFNGPWAKTKTCPMNVNTFQFGAFISHATKEKCPLENTTLWLSATLYLLPTVSFLCHQEVCSWGHLCLV